MLFCLSVRPSCWSVCLLPAISCLHPSGTPLLSQRENLLPYRHPRTFPCLNVYVLGSVCVLAKYNVQLWNLMKPMPAKEPNICKVEIKHSPRWTCCCVDQWVWSNGLLTQGLIWQPVMCCLRRTVIRWCWVSTCLPFWLIWFEFFVGFFFPKKFLVFFFCLVFFVNLLRSLSLSLQCKGLPAPPND